MGNSMSKEVSIKAIIYSAGPFFGYPWKPIMNAVYGGDYLESYKHFRMQHMVPIDLFYHCLCLVWQLSSNYAFLGSIDETLEKQGYVQPKTRIIATANSLFWAWHLVRTNPTPLSVKVLSCLCIYIAHSYAGKMFHKHWEKIVFLQGFIEAAAFQIFSGRISLRRYLGYLVARTALWKYLSTTKRGALKEYNTSITTGLISLILYNSTRQQPLSGTVSMGMYGWIIALLTDNKNTYFWSCGMTATLAQGVAHNLSREAGTLAVLENSKIDMTAYELSHVVFFPNLLFQAIHANFGL